MRKKNSPVNNNLKLDPEILKRLMSLRVNNNLTQSALALELGIKQTTYSGYETGNRQIPLSFLEQLSDFYGVSLEYIVKGADFTPSLGGISDDERAFRSMLSSAGFKSYNSKFTREQEVIAKSLMGIIKAMF